MNAKLKNHRWTTALGRWATASRVAWLLAVLVWSCAQTIVAAEMPALTEYQVKALFLVNFAKYVDWPPKAFADGGAPIDRFS